MQHAFYAVFDDRSAAEAAARALGSGEARCEVAVLQGRIRPNELPMRETRTVRQVFVGLFLGALLGSLGGLLVVATGVAGWGSVWIMATLGAVACAVGGAITGTAAPDPKLDELSHQIGPGRALVSVTAPSLAAMERAETVAREHGATSVERKILS